jgi:nicotinate phosphoribosyltransferase
MSSTVPSFFPAPTNNLVSPLLTDLYQITMAYAYWKTNQHRRIAHFELFFRKNPFGGSYTLFAGLDEVLKFLANFRFSDSDIYYLRNTPQLSHCEDAFFDDYLSNLDCSEVIVHSLKEGSMAFPRVPLITITAPLGIGNLIETTLLTLVNYPSLVATNACRMVVAARGQFWEETAGANPPRAYSPPSKLNRGGGGGIGGRGGGTSSGGVLGDSLYFSKTPRKSIQLAEGGPLDFSRKKPRCVEFGLRRAQGPDGGFSASKYSHIGGFHATSNLLAGKILNLPIAGTHAHSFVQSFTSLDSVEGASVKRRKGGSDDMVELLPLALQYREETGWTDTNEGELAAFIGYASSFPDGFLCLIDTYDTLQSGLRNFVIVSLVLDDLGYTPRGIRLDSGDLSYLSLECEFVFHQMADRFDRSFFFDLDIVASNDINESILHSLNKQGHAITMFGIGTNLVTCESQPALGCVYKLVEVDGKPRIKLSNDMEKVLIPGRKVAYRLFGEAGWPLLDLLVGVNEADQPSVGERTLCVHPFMEQKRVAVVPTRVVKLHRLVFDGKNGGVVLDKVSSLDDTRQFVKDQINHTRPDMLRYVNPGEYKVSVSEQTFRFLHNLWQSETPVRELR